MSCRGSLAVGTIVVAAISLALSTASGPVHAQTLEERDYQVPRTPDGQPDLQGTWTNDTLTPFERPRSLGNREFLSEAEADQIEKRAVERAARANENRPARRA
jgi:hypothetical protein